MEDKNRLAADHQSDKTALDEWANVTFTRENMQKRLQSRTWETVRGFNVSIGECAGANLTTGSVNFLYGAGVGSALTSECGRLIIVLPNNRLLVADLIAETAEFMDYSDDAACVAPEFREKGH